MSLQHFQSDETLRSTEALRAQRMTADEAASVIALWQQEQTELTGLTDRPAVPDVAEGLDITVEDVQRLLETVRAQRLEEERALAQEQELAEAERRLAEEERKLTEIQRQRAELRREQAERRREQPTAWQSQIAEPAGTVWSLGKIITWITVTVLVFVLVFALAFTKTPHPGGLVPCYINGQEATEEDCRAFEHGNGAVIQKYMQNDNK